VIWVTANSTVLDDTTGNTGSGTTAVACLALAPGNAQVTLSWSATTNATSYSVYRGTTSGGEGGTAIGTVSAPSPTLNYTDTGLTNDIEYYYKVKAFDSGGMLLSTTIEASGKPESTY